MGHAFYVKGLMGNRPDLLHESRGRAELRLNREPSTATGDAQVPGSVTAGFTEPSGASEGLLMVAAEAGPRRGGGGPLPGV